MGTEPTAADRAQMARALELAERGWGRVHPNPLVGAVVVRDGAVVGEGYHAEYGGPHAEVVALREAGDRARGATLYVTLEPCAHHGKTPPCTDAILEAGVRRVVIAAGDPSPDAGGGAARLRAAGIEVVEGVERERARSQNAAFFHAVERGSPYVVLKYALSLDARLSEAPGRPTAVTGAAALRETHRLRAGYDAILVGIGTVLADDPLLTVRGAVVPRVPPVRIILDTQARLPLESRLVRSVDETPVWVVCRDTAPVARRNTLEAAGVRILEVGSAGPGGSGLDPGAVLDRLRAERIRSVFCEGGGRVGAALLAGDHVERLTLFYAPRLFGDGGVPAFPARFGTGPAAGWRRRRVAVFGEDTLIEFDRSR